jgi:hypothetical protein
MKERSASFLIGQLGVDAKTRSDGVGVPHRLWATDMERLGKLLTRHGTNVNVAMQATAAYDKSLQDNDVVRFIGLSRGNPPNSRNFRKAELFTPMRKLPRLWALPAGIASKHGKT